MTNETAREILQIMAKGIDPITGEILPSDHLCNYPKVTRALCLAIQLLSTASPINTLSINKKNGKLNAGRPWTKEDLLELEQLYLSGASIDTICQQLQRRVRGVQKQLEYLGLNHTSISSASPSHSLERTGQRWTREEDTLLNDLYIEKWPIPEIATEMRRSEYSIFCRMDKLGLYGEKYGYPIKDAASQWSHDDIMTLREMFLSGKTVEDIAKQMGRNEKSISARLFYMGLSKESPVNIPHQGHTDK